MTILLKIALLAVVVAYGSGCRTGYWKDRGRDAADIFTFTVGVGIGAKAQVGPIHSGLLLQGDSLGLRGGAFLRGHGDVWLSDKAMDAFFLILGYDSFKSTGPSIRMKDHQGFYLGPLVCFLTDYEDVPAHVYTQIDVVVALGPSVRLGFNPGELLDFLLGFAGVDVYDDDEHERKKDREEKISPAPPDSKLKL